MHSSFLTSLAILAATPLVIADCTSFNGISWQADSRLVSSANQQFLNSVTCPSKNDTCYVPRQTYEITVPRSLNAPVSAADEDNIFALAQAYFGTGGNVTAQPFEDKTAMINTFDTKETSNDVLEVKPGWNTTLYFVPFFMYSEGNLSGCSNESLNGMVVRAQAPYFSNDTRNNSILAGAWASETKDTKKSSAGSLKGNGLSVALMGSVVVLLGLTL